MRAKRTPQISIFDQFAAHQIGRELQGMSEQLDAHPVLLDLVADDLGASAATGRCGMSADSVLRCALLKQYRQLSYEELAFHLLDSASFQAFARLPMGRAPKKASLQANIPAMSHTSWEAINQHLLGAACQAGVERGTLWRVDSMAIDSPIRAPSDSSLLLDGVRVMVRLLEAGAALPGGQKRRAHGRSTIPGAKTKSRRCIAIWLR